MSKIQTKKKQKDKPNLKLKIFAELVTFRSFKRSKSLFINDFILSTKSKSKTNSNKFYSFVSKT